jgi:hypothetical protein
MRKPHPRAINTVKNQTRQVDRLLRSGGGLISSRDIRRGEANRPLVTLRKHVVDEETTNDSRARKKINSVGSESPSAEGSRAMGGRDTLGESGNLGGLGVDNLQEIKSRRYEKSKKRHHECYERTEDVRG